MVVGHYVASVSATTIAGWRFTGFVRPEDLATLVAIGAIGVLWLRIRIGRDIARDRMTRAVWIGVGILVLALVWAWITVARSGAGFSSLVAPLRASDQSPDGRPLDAVLAYVLGFALVAARHWRR